ncbi:Uncharacterised protein [Vibrio cholerae]|uniref:Uncharacterized protein n=1 Tax=Vibrio cholerae TaxID=666 RepID=A0A656ALB1_VIBCL|nr:Uncharacterised protein [Vibrio cholerae]CSA94374.1 Uncharacterised protein [Vibrio cholerae]CSD18108.1 Uncharacterised protein [Vibrio cholerae]CSI88858.1 Uncharacterised protein [Vibrio cholerae]
MRPTQSIAPPVAFHNASSDADRALSHQTLTAPLHLAAPPTARLAVRLASLPLTSVHCAANSLHHKDQSAPLDRNDYPVHHTVADRCVHAQVLH